MVTFTVTLNKSNCDVLGESVSLTIPLSQHTFIDEPSVLIASYWILKVALGFSIHHNNQLLLLSCC